MGLFGPPNVDKLKAKKDVKGLIKALGYKKDGNVRASAAAALGEIGDPQAVEPLIAALSDPHVRQDAVTSLGQISDARAIEPLIACLTCNEDSISLAAAAALKKLGTPAIEPLVAALAMRSDSRFFTRNTPARRAIAAALKELGWEPDQGVVGAAYWLAQRQWKRCITIGAPAVDLLIATLDDQDRTVRKNAAAALGEIGETRTVSSLIRMLKDKDARVRETAAQALGQIGNPQAIAPLSDALEDDDYQVSLAAVTALGQIKDERVLEPLVAALQDKSCWRKKAAGLQKQRSVRLAAADTLDRLGWRPPRGAAGAEYWIVREQWDRCIRIGSPAVEPLITALRFSDSFTARSAAAALGQIGNKRAVEPLVEALQNKELCQAASQALGQIGAPAAEPLVLALKNTPVRQTATQVLEQIGAPAMKPLVAALEDKDTSVVSVAARILSQIGDAQAVEPLIALLQSSSWATRKTAAEVLVALYQSGRLDEEHQRLILAQRWTIAGTHTDQVKHDDEWKDRSEVGRRFASDCTHNDFSEHQDYGIGVGFPV